MKNSQILGAIIGFTAIGIVQAATPVAIVEDIQAKDAGISFMDYVHAGQVIKLGKQETLILGYLESCRRETITGGTVTIGTMQSKISKGQLMREDVECDGGQARLSGQQAGTSGALAFRSGSAGLAQPEVTIYGSAPVFRLHTPDATITVEPFRHRGRSHTIEVHGQHVDLADKNISLPPGIYKVTAGDNSKLFKVHHRAEPGKGPIITRLVDL